VRDRVKGRDKGAVIALNTDDEQANWMRQIGLLTGIPILLAVGPIIGYFAGNWLDGKFGTEPTFTIILIVLGFVASGKEVYRLIKRATKDLK